MGVKYASFNTSLLWQVEPVFECKGKVTRTSQSSKMENAHLDCVYGCVGLGVDVC